MNTVEAEISANRGDEVLTRDRFEFGKNWQVFLRSVTAERIKLAEKSLAGMLQTENLEGLRFLDVGSGSGLFSLAARNLGASVVSFDYDPQSVACTAELRRRYYSSSADWRVEQGSVLDREYLQRLGQFDVVLSWGVLHHTGSMWDALGNVADLVKSRGQLFIALYNDQGLRSKVWYLIKRTYNRMPRALRFTILWPVALYTYAGVVMSDLVSGRSQRAFATDPTPRGMSLWTDIVDWTGGYPFEVAQPGEILAFYRNLGFNLERLITCGGRCGCNEFVFRRADGAATQAGK